MEDIDPDHQAEMSEKPDRFETQNVPLTLLSFLFFGGLNQTGHWRPVDTVAASLHLLQPSED